MAPKISEQERETRLLDTIIKMDPERKNWRVRFHIVNALVGIVPLICKY